MKKVIIISSLALSIFSSLFCSKSKIEVSPDNFTECSSSSKCSYLFTEQADIESAYRIKSGNYRLFWNTTDNDLGSCELTSTLWIKAPMNANSFLLHSDDIKQGMVSYSHSCVCCSLIGLKPIGGYVKGINTTPEKRADQTKWLIEAEIILGAIQDNKPVDTLYLKQYFNPNFVYD